MTSVDRPVTDPLRRTLLNPHPVSPGWMVGGILGTTGATLKWFMEQVWGMAGSPDDFAALETEAARVGPGARGLVCLTGLTGERAPLWNPQARGVLFGLDLTHGRGEIARAIMEGVALSVRGVAEILQGIGAPLIRIRVVGGGSSSELWNQIRADATGLSVERPRLTEGTAIGTLLLTGLGVGLFADLGEAARQVAPVERVYTPDPRARETYERLAGVQRQIYAGACSSFGDLAQFRQ
jgi:sugar (pentulose or hexulose) kinase